MIIELMIQHYLTSPNIKNIIKSRKIAYLGAKFFLAPCFFMLIHAISWEQSKVGEWGNFYYGQSCPKWSVTEDATTPCIRYGEMYTKFGCKIDRVYSYTNIPKENLKFSKGTEV